MSRLLKYTLLVMLFLHTSVAKGNHDRVVTLSQELTRSLSLQDYRRCLAQADTLMNLYTSGTQDSLFAQSFLLAGNASVCANEYISAFTFYTVAIEQAIKYGKHRTYQISTCNIGFVYAYFKDYERALYYFDKSREQALSLGNDQIAYIASLNLAISLCKLGREEQASSLIHQIYEGNVPDSLNQQRDRYFLHGMLAMSQQDYQQAIASLHLALRSSLGNLPIHTPDTQILLELSTAFQNNGQPDSAIDCCMQVLSISGGIDSLSVTCEAYQRLSSVYLSQGPKDSADLYRHKYLELSDSVFNIRQFNAAKDRLTRYESEVNDQQLHALQGDVHQLSAIIKVVFAAFLLLAGLLVYRLYIRRRRQEALAETAEESKSAPALLLSEERRLSLAAEIEKVMCDTSVIIDKDFSLRSLAELTGTNTKYVSEAINETYHKNFKTLLNEYRIREACRRLKDAEQYGAYSIDSIAMSVGYSSMNNFSTVFKKIVGVSPSTYRKTEQ